MRARPLFGGITVTIVHTQKNYSRLQDGQKILKKGMLLTLILYLNPRTKISLLMVRQNIASRIIQVSQNGGLASFYRKIQEEI